MIVCHQAIEYKDNNKILYNYESGFRCIYALETPMHLVVSDMKKNLKELGVGIFAGFIDVRRVLETIQRNVFLHKLINYCFSGTISKWLE